MNARTLKIIDLSKEDDYDRMQRMQKAVVRRNLNEWKEQQRARTVADSRRTFARSFNPVMR